MDKNNNKPKMSDIVKQSLKKEATPGNNKATAWVSGSITSIEYFQGKDDGHHFAAMLHQKMPRDHEQDLWVVLSFKPVKTLEEVQNYFLNKNVVIPCVLKRWTKMLDKSPDPSCLYLLSDFNKRIYVEGVDF